MNEEKKVILKTVSIDLRAHKDIAKIIREAMKIFKTDKKSKAVIFALQEWYALRKKYPILVDLYKELTKEVRESIAKWWRSLAPTERMVIFSLLSFLSYTATLLAFHSLVGVET